MQGEVGRGEGGGGVFSYAREEGGRGRQVYETLLTDVETSSASVEAAAEVCSRASRSRRAARSTVALRDGAGVSHARGEDVTLSFFLVLSGEKSSQTRQQPPQKKKKKKMQRLSRVSCILVFLKALCVESCAHSYTADFTVQT